MKGFPKWLVKFNFFLAVPIVNFGKHAGRLPIIKNIVNLFFIKPFNQVTAIPIRHVAVNESIDTQSTTLPLGIIDKLVEAASYVMILNECVCRSYYRKGPENIGCMVLGKAALDIHPSNGRIVNIIEAKAHIRKAADAGLVANVAHVWIDPVGFGVTSFKNMLFICFCGHDSCLYTDNLNKRCPNLDKAYKKLDGMSVVIDESLCSGCGICAEKCFVSAIQMNDGKAVIGDVCKGCGRCISECPESAMSLRIDDFDSVFSQLLKRISYLADIV
jgi:UDP-glucose 4-epimerase